VYLEAVAQRLRSSGCEVETQALRGEVTSSLIAQEARAPIDLVVMTTHGGTGLARFALGSVAERVVRRERAPVLLLRSFMGDGLGLAERLERALVPLDGSARAELALEICTRLAGPVLKQVTLARVVETEHGHDAEQVGEATQMGAREYLRGILAEHTAAFTTRGCSLAADVLVGDVADAILRRADKDCDLIVMATHGRTGAARWALGSIANRVLHGATLPLLLMRTALAVDGEAQGSTSAS
jgi:nucleotide-binding universal stress UspA family protein